MTEKRAPAWGRTFDSQRAKVWIWILAAAVAARLLVAAFMPLGVDEAYAVAVAREFSWSFFDHPPLGFWAPVVMGKLSGLEAPLALRLPHLLFGGLSAGLIYLIGRELGGRNAGWWTLVLFLLSPAFALTGVFILPDGPLAVGAGFAVLWLLRIVKAGKAATIGQWLLVGLGLAVALASKYQAGLVAIAALGFAIFHPAGRRWFATPGPWLASALGLLGLAPVLWWNLQTDWASFAFHAARTGDGLQPGNFARMLAGQAIYLLPPVLLAGLLGIRHAFRQISAERFLVALIALAPIVLFNLLYLFSARSFPHWTMLGWQFAMPLAGLWLAQSAEGVRARMLAWIGGFAALTWLVVLALVWHLNTGILTRFLEPSPPAWDDTLQVYDYRGLDAALDERGDLDGVTMIAAPDWMVAGAMSYGFGGRMPVRVLWGNPHHFAFMRAARMQGDALLLEPALLAQAAARQEVLLQRARAIDPDARALEPVPLARGGAPYGMVNVIRLHLTAMEGRHG